MTEEKSERYRLFDHPPSLYEAMLEDIEQAREYIYIETYKFGNDSIGSRFRNALTKKAREGIKIKLLIDSWGAGIPLSYFSEMIRYGAEVRFFKKIVLAFDFFTKNHRRNHRKLLIIDDHITYIGSANIAGHSIKWRELQLRLKGKIAIHFKRSFLSSFKIFNKYIFNKFTYRKAIYYCDFEIIQDIPSIYRQRIKKKYEELIKKAKKEIIIETPYFIPGFKLRKELIEAAIRGVDVKILMPEHSDVRIVDLLRNKYLGQMHRNNVKILFYTPTNLHAKAVLIDNKIFGIGSANFDYRSFRYLHEIALFGSNAETIRLLRNHLNETLIDCIPFDYDAWKRRPIIEKALSLVLVPFRHLF
jgi:cardiolipin synthase A/B